MNCAIVLAGGKGTRMNSEIPKQFLVVGGKPLISYSLDVFEKSPFIDAIIIVTSQDYTGYMKALVKENGYKKIAGIALGGKERYDSVHSGLELIQTLMSSGAGQLSRDEEWLSGEDYIFIHDGARPCVTAQIIYNCMQDVMEYKACVAAVPVKDTIKVADKAGMSVNTPDRSTLWQIQTPQTFSYELIYQAYRVLITSEENTAEPEQTLPYDSLLNKQKVKKLQENRGQVHVTDDAMVVELLTDIPVKLVRGSYQNIKITTPEDLKIAEALCEKKQ